MISIEEILREYKHKKSIVDTTVARIDQYKYAIGHPEMIMDRQYSFNSREIGMPGAPLRNTASPVERFITDKELTIDVLQEWIKDDESRVFFKKLEVEQINLALNSLTPQEKYIIDLKYFNDMFWRDIEINFNGKFRQKNYLSYEMLKKINKDALDKLSSILQPFYNQFQIA